VNNLTAVSLVYGLDAGQGFDVGQAMQHGKTKMGSLGVAVPTDPRSAAGQTAIHGIAGSSITPDQKAQVATTVAASSATARAAAATTIVQVTPGPFTRLWRFFFGGL
jgi:hypothetical protein